MSSEVVKAAMPARQSLTSQNGVNLKVVNSGGQGQVQSARSAAIKEVEMKLVDAEENKERLENSVQRLNELVSSVQRDLQFSIDQQSGKTVITVLDSTTEEVVRQIPSEEVLALARNIETLKGVLFSAEVLACFLQAIVLMARKTG